MICRKNCNRRSSTVPGRLYQEIELSYPKYIRALQHFRDQVCFGGVVEGCEWEFKLIGELPVVTTISTSTYRK